MWGSRRTLVRTVMLLSALIVAGAFSMLVVTASAATPTEPACGSNATPSISLDVPKLVAHGHDGVGVYGYQNDSATGDNGVVAGTMTIYIYNVSVTPAQLVQTVDVPAGDDPSSDTQENLLTTFTPEPLGESLEVVATYETSYTDYSSYPLSSDVPCDQSVTATTLVGAGGPPKVSFGHIHVSGVGEELVVDMNPAQGSCYSQIGGWTQRRNSYLSETWTLGRRKWQMFLTPCYERAPFRTPPGIQPFNATQDSSAVDQGGFELWLAPLAPGNFFNARYGFVVAFNHHALYRGHMTTYYKYTPGYRVYEGTDAFVNYCINGGHQTYSSNLVLYCNHPAQTVAYVELS